MKNNKKKKLINNKGLSLTEVCVTLCVVAIIGAVGVANFGSYQTKTDKRSLHTDAKLWTQAVRNCLLSVSSMGGWKVKTWKTTDTAEPTNVTYPCRALLQNKNDDSKEDEFKKVLGWDCPAESVCEGVVDTGNKRYCLSIKKEIKSTKHQVIVHFDIKKQLAKIYCGTPASYQALTDCEANPSYKSWNADNTANQCEWPIPSDPGTS